MYEDIIRIYVRHVLMEKKSNKKKKKQPGAGLVIVKKIEGDWKVLGLKLYGMYDIPKGGIEKKDKDNRFVTACRECIEECGIAVSSKDLLWGSESINVSHLTIFLAATDQDPVIQKNEKTGIYEHHSASWLDWETMENMAYSYLKPAIMWAKTKVKSDI